MHNAIIAGSLEVMGAAALSGKLRALQGVELGDGGRLMALLRHFQENGINMSRQLDLILGQNDP